MRWLSRFSAPVFDRVRNESGAVIVFVAVAMVVLLGMTAFVIDFGRIWQERRELQAGATAGALAIGEDCAWGLCDAGYNKQATAELYADANALDGAASVVVPVNLDLTGQTVRVVTATENSSGGNTMEMLFAGIVGFDTITVGADAAVAWGTPLKAATIPLIFSDCEWRSDEPGWPGASPGGLPDPATAPAGTMVTITFHTTEDREKEKCDAHPGHDADMDGKLPAGFGWLDANSDCETEVTEGSLVSNDPGNSKPAGCSASDFEDLLGEVVLIPYFSDFDGITGQGKNGKYVIEAHGPFLVAGYNFGSRKKYQKYDPDLTSGVPCSGSVRCIAGWFVRNVSHGGGSGGFGGEDRGAVVIKLIG